MTRSDGVSKVGRLVPRVATACLLLLSVSHAESKVAPHAEAVKAWRDDLKVFARQLPRRHANAFHRISRGTFRTEVAALDRKLGGLNADQVWVGFQRIESSIGDGHTLMRLPKDAPRFGLRFKRFGGDYRLIAIAPGAAAREVLGARLLRVDGVSADEVHRKLLSLTAQDERLPLRELRAEPMLSNGLVLHGLGVAKLRDAGTFALEDDSGHSYSIRVVARDGSSEAHWVEMSPSLENPNTSGNEAIKCKNLGEPQVLYCEFRSYNDLKRGAQAMFARVHAEDIRRLILDLRRNNGGDFCEGLKQVVQPIAQNVVINRPGGLFVLIGPQTFSAAMSNSVHFRQLTQAILVGQPIGEKPNSYQEIEDLTLPNTGWVARYSTRFYRFVNGGENVIRPDIEIDQTWNNYKHGIDPVLAYIRALPLDLPKPPAKRTPVSPAEGETCT